MNQSASDVLSHTIIDNNASHMAMLRAAIALLWADDALEAAEISVMQRLIDDNSQLTDAQKSQLHGELVDNTKENLNGLWGAITNPHDRAHLINIATMLCWSDNQFEQAERDAYNMINKLHVQTLDVDALQAELSVMAEEARMQAQEDQALIEQSESVSEGFKRVLGYVASVFS